MSIVQETYAKCDGCGQREQGETHPATWPALIDAAGKRYYCSHTCLLQSAANEGIRQREAQLPAGLRRIEVDLLELVALGLTNKEVGMRLHIREQTVKNRMSSCLRKLAAAEDSCARMTRTEAVLVAHRLGVLNLRTLADRCAARWKSAA